MEICLLDVVYSRKFLLFSAGQGVAMDIPIEILTANHSNDRTHQDLPVDANTLSVARPIQKLYSLKWDWNGSFTATWRCNNLGRSTILAIGQFKATISKIG